MNTEIIIAIIGLISSVAVQFEGTGGGSAVRGGSEGGGCMTVVTYGGTLSHEEMDMIKEKAAQIKGCDHVSVTIDGDWLDIDYHVMPFERIRRITGYLVGTLDRFNDAKRAEVADRVKHDVTGK